jgi:hypothetical protein
VTIASAIQAWRLRRISDLGHLLLGGLLALLGLLGLLGRLRLLGRLGALATGSLGLLAGLLGQKSGVDVGQNTSLGDGDRAEQLVQLLVVAGSQLDVAGHDARALGVAGGVASELQELGAQVLHHTGQVHGGTAGHTGRVAAAPQITRHTANRERESRTAGAALGLASLGLTTSSLSFARHCTMKSKSVENKSRFKHTLRIRSPAMESSCTRHFSRDICQCPYILQKHTF